MPMLQSILDKKIRLIDYELLKDENSKRLVQFSKFAGYAGMVDGLHSLARRLLALGYGSPFLAIGMSYMYRCLADARLDVIRSGLVIQDDGLPRELGPMTFIFTGSGNVTQGALHVFKCLPHEWVSANELKDLFHSPSFDSRKVYGCQVDMKDYIVSKDGSSPFDRKTYLDFPDRFESVFADKIAPYSRMILNGIFWDSKYPRLLSIKDVARLQEKNQLPLLTVADVSCDIQGSIEFTSKASTIDDPYFMFDPKSSKEHSDVDGPGIQIMSIDNLPTEMPLEASDYFGSSLFPFIVELAKGNDQHPVLKGAAITTFEGCLAPAHSKLSQSLNKYAKLSKKRVLILGSGYVAPPVVDYLQTFTDFHITIVGNQSQELKKYKVNTCLLDLRKHDQTELDKLISNHDLVISLVPASMHPQIAEKCIQFKKHMVTASYISPALSCLDALAKKAGITILNEVGLDPGIDHLTALSAFKEIQSKGNKITEFISWCGGLPAPEASDNPLGYKFSWSPQGVLLATMNPAEYLLNEEKVGILGKDLLKSVQSVSIMNGFALEGIPNRDSMKYISLYNLNPQDLKTMFRGTLRYKGFCDLMDDFKSIGLLNNSSSNHQMNNWKSVMESLLGLPLSTPQEQLNALKNYTNPKKSETNLSNTRNALEWLGLFSKSTRFEPKDTLFDSFCYLLQEKLVYNKNERDVVIMHHIFGYENPKGNHFRRTSTMVAYGDPQGYSAMAKTVGYPTAIAAEMILKNQITQKGVIAPMEKEIYEPMLDKLKVMGIEFKDRVL